MKVKELKEILNKFEDDMNVYVRHPDRPAYTLVIGLMSHDSVSIILDVYRNIELIEDNS